MATTSNYSLRYPVDSDAVDIAGHFANLASDIDSTLYNSFVPKIGGTYTGGLSGTTLSLSSTLSVGGNTSLSGDLTVSKASPSLTVNASSGNSDLILKAVAGSQTRLYLQTGSTARWSINKNSSTESGTNAGSNFEINAYSDAGSLLSTPLTITRSTGAVTLGYTLSVASTSTFNNDVTINKASSDLTLRLNPTSGYSIISLDRASGQWGYIQARTGTSKRWIFGVNGDSESGANAGSNFFMYTYDDAGSYLANPLFINRANSLFTLAGDVIISKASAYLRVAGTTGTQGRILIDTAASGTDAYLQLRTGVNARWGIYKDSTAESGSNAGSNFKIIAFDDAGSTIGTALEITRSNRDITLYGNTAISKSDARLYVNSSANDSMLGISSVANKYAFISLRTSSSDRWLIMKSNYGEPGSNVGSDLLVRAYADDGTTLLSTPLTIERATGKATFINDITVNTAANAYLDLRAVTSNAAGVSMRTGSSTRWTIAKTSAAESGSNAGSNFVIQASDDAGSVLSTPLTITRSTGAFTLTGDVTISKATAQLKVTATSAAPLLSVRGNAGQERVFDFRTDASRRWRIITDTTSESGANAGSDFAIQSYDDSSAFIANVFYAKRSSGMVTLGSVGATAGLELGSSGPRIMSGSGSPEGVVTAPVGSTLYQTDSTVGVTHWRKATGAGNTGWVVMEGDTGVRDLSAVLSNSWTATRVRLRRVGQMVTVSGYSLVSTSATNDVFYTLPSGFRIPDTTYMPTARNGTNVGYVGSDGSLGMESRTGTYHFAWSWATSDAWPSSLPGS